MIEYTIIFICGFAIGAGTFIAHKRSVQKAVTNERVAAQKVIEKLKCDADRFFAERNQLLKEKELNQAYMRGRESPLSDVEKFAKTLESRRAKLVDTTKP